MIIRVVDDVMVEVNAVIGLELIRFDTSRDEAKLRILLNGGAEIDVEGSTAIMENAMSRLSDENLK